MARTPFPTETHLTGLAVAFKNTDLIADQVLPYRSVKGTSFKYTEYSLAEGFTVPDTRVGRTSTPSRVEFSGREITASCDDHYLDDVVPRSDINDAPEGFDPLAVATEGIMDLILLAREKRAADLVFNPAMYATGNKETLSGTSQFSDFANSDPIRVIQEALDSMIIRANAMVIGRAVFSKLSMHPKIVAAVHGNSGDSGIATRKAIADLFELQNIYVGEGWLNTAQKGKDVSLGRVWGKHIALIHQSPGKMTYGFTARVGNRTTKVIEDEQTGADGSLIVRAGEKVKEVIMSDRLGYFIQNAVA